MSTREQHLHQARVYRREAEARRETQPGFARTLLEWADAATARAEAATHQHEMFT